MILKFTEILNILKNIFNILLSTFILFCILPLIVLDFIYAFIKSFINEHNKYYEDNSIS